MRSALHPCSSAQIRGWLLLGLLATLTACDRARSLGDRGFRSPRDEYVQALEEADLHRTAVGRDWIAAGDAALSVATHVSAPHREAVHLPASEPRAVAWRVPLRRGDRLIASAEVAMDPLGRLFIDLFSAPRDTTETYERVASAPDGGTAIDVEIRRDGEYVLRAQPELLRGGRVVVTITTGPTLAFPVAGRDARIARSLFGAPRDAGRRSHHGVDLFAPRGTPVVAAAPGIVRRVGETDLGGNVVWLLDTRREQSLYYAHLDRQLVDAGDIVQVGDTLGLVGNTGNARSTPPHLHFGIYRRGQGPVDPLPFIDTRRGTPPEITADTSLFGARMRIARAQVVMRPSPRANGDSTRAVPRSAVLTVLGAAGGWLRVRLPGGEAGFVTATAVQRLGAPITVVSREAGVVLRERPSPAAVIVDSLPSRARLSVLGRYGRWLLVATEEKREGWIAE
ncbi:MAG TPA: M23 family metallopeptidase [Gemmatimonadaceae bacterium]|nr:M23 family metallopeptidase [Gemmatimonadaceae bacterium]